MQLKVITKHNFNNVVENIDQEVVDPEKIRTSKQSIAGPKKNFFPAN